VSRQAERLGYLPRLTVLHTSKEERGQIYVPAVNWTLFIGVILLLVIFQSSERLATAYGLAVTGTFLITTTLFLIYAEAAWHWKRWQLLLLGVPLAGLELTYFGANLTKLFHGGWLPVLIAIIVATVMLTWQRGRILVTERRAAMEGPIDPFIDWLHGDPVAKVAGTAVFMHPDKLSTPLALRENATFNHVIHETVLIVSTTSRNIPFVADAERVELDHLGDPYDAITHLTLHFGFQEDQDVPRALAVARDLEIFDVDPDTAYYFLSRITLQRGPGREMSPWRKRLFLGLAHNAASPTQYFRLPEDRTVAMGAAVIL
jgi:KUP system potassium uptake protein